MGIYDPEVEPSAAERIALVTSWHRRRAIRVPQMTLHATIHVVVENQIALGQSVVIDALARLRAEGLTRHDALHAVGMVLAEHIYDLLKSTSATATDPNPPYLDRLRRLTAAEWLRFG
jgi:predicted RNase H-like nuclease